jgi:hypothetical protein
VETAAIITGVAGVITAAGGILLSIRAVRDRERKAAKNELDTVNTMLAQEREQRIQAELDTYKARLKLAQHGITNGES